MSNNHGPIPAELTFSGEHWHICCICSPVSKGTHLITSGARSPGAGAAAARAAAEQGRASQWEMCAAAFPLLPPLPLLQPIPNGSGPLRESIPFNRNSPYKPVTGWPGSSPHAAAVPAPTFWKHFHTHSGIWSFPWEEKSSPSPILQKRKMNQVVILTTRYRHTRESVG